MAVDQTLVERVRRYLAAHDDLPGGVAEKRMVGGLSFMVGGRMCCGVTSTGLMVRLGRDGVGRALAEPQVRQLELGGKPIEAFAVVHPAGFADDAALGCWIDRALAFLRSEGFGGLTPQVRDEPPSSPRTGAADDLRGSAAQDEARRSSTAAASSSGDSSGTQCEPGSSTNR